MNRVLVTGGSGYIGSRLVKRLLDSGVGVHVVVRPTTDRSFLDQEKPEPHVHVYDGTLDSLRRILEASRPSVIFHVASLFLAQHRPEQVADLVRSNVLFGAELLEAACHSGCPALVNVGTSWQHDREGNYSPTNLYAATKQAFQDILKFYVEVRNLRATTVKLFDTYGPDDPRRKIMTLLIDAVVSGTPLELSPGDQLLDLVFIEDVVDGLLAAADGLMAGLLPNGSEYALSSGRPLSLKELVRQITDLYPGDHRIHLGAKPYREREVMVPCSALVPLPGWVPKTSLASGLSQLLVQRKRTLRDDQPI